VNDEPLPGQQEAAPEPGWIEPALAEEFPALGLFTTTVDAGDGRSPEPVREKLRELSDRFGGQQAIVLRQRPIPWAYRVFFRHIGLDPDETRTPPEQLALDRMFKGSFKSRGRVADAITIAVAEVGVSVQAFDAGAISGRLGLRVSAEGEELGGRSTALPTGTIVIADEEKPLAVLFGAVAPGAEAGKSTERTTVAAVRVKGVPDAAIEEALWLAASTLLS
jgi:DNA/RNA-binding domain of Phe-tRNA-synthetase-like protein